MSENSINVNNSFYLPQDGVSMEEFEKLVKNDKKLIDIYKAFDKNGDNKLSRDELAEALGTYKQFDENGDNKLSSKERKAYKNSIESGLKNDGNTANDSVKIKSGKLNDFFSVLKSMVNSKDKSANIYEYDENGNITGGVDFEGDEFKQTNHADKSYTRKYKNYGEYNYNAKGEHVGGKKNSGREYTVISRTKDGYSYKFSDNNEVKNYGNDGFLLGGTDPKGRDYSRTYNDDGTYLDTFNDGEIVNYDKDGNITGGKRVVKDLHHHPSETNILYDYKRTNNGDGTYTNTYTNNSIRKEYDNRGQLKDVPSTETFSVTYDSKGNVISGVDKLGKSWKLNKNNDGSYDFVLDADGYSFYNRYEHNPDGSYTEQCINSDNGNIMSVLYYDSQGRVIACNNNESGGIDIQNEYNPDGSYSKQLLERNGNVMSVYYYDSQGKNTAIDYDADGTIDMTSEYQDGYIIRNYGDAFKEFYFNEYRSASTFVDEDGNISTTAVEGESFEATMTRLGITDADDIEAFRAANPRAARKGYFMVGKQDVSIPKALVDSLKAKNQLDFGKMMVDAGEQIDNWKERTGRQ